jgi:hypothetical protein
MAKPQLQPDPPASEPAPAPRSVQIRLGSSEADLDAMIDMAHAVHKEFEGQGIRVQASSRDSILN